jgi:MOSC domain-containing protein YiiM
VLADSSLPYGSFGENVTTQDWLDDRVYVGEKYRIGTAVVMVTIPRKPCYKLNARLGRDDILTEISGEQAHGFYLAVIEEGDIGAGDAINLLESHRLRVTQGTSLTSTSVIALTANCWNGW